MLVELGKYKYIYEVYVTYILFINTYKYFSVSFLMKIVPDSLHILTEMHPTKAYRAMGISRYITSYS